MSFEPASEFKEYALNLDDIDGGNPHAPLWFCGIEPGSTGGDDLSIFKRNVYRGVNTGLPCWDDKFREDHDDFRTWRVDRSIASLLVHLNDELKHNIYNVDEYMESKLYIDSLAGHSFKMNLFPLKKEKADKWEPKYGSRTGFDSLRTYQTWCQIFRFPNLRKLLLQYPQPKTIICFGITYLPYLVGALVGEIPYSASPVCNRDDIVEISGADKVNFVFTKFITRCGIDKIASVIREQIHDKRLTVSRD